MALTCNIDRRGRFARTIWGLGLLALAAALATGLIAVESAWLRWGVVVALSAFGLLGLFEAARGWCIVRAMGYKTPI